MTESDPIQTVNFHTRELPSFHIRPLQSFCYPTSRQTTTEAPHRHNFQEIIWIKTGTGKQSIDGISLDIEAQTFYLIARGQVHQFIEGRNINGFVLRYSDEFLPAQTQPGARQFRNAIFNNLNSIHTLHVEPAEVCNFDRLFGQMTSEQENNEDFATQLILGHMLQILLLMLERLLNSVSSQTPEKNDDRHDLFRAFITHLEQDYQQHHEIAYYARLLNIPARQLSDITRRMVGKTGKRVIEERLMLEAKRYLKFSDQSVKEIAYALGYEDPSYFSKVFKKLTGTSPQAHKDA